MIESPSMNAWRARQRGAPSQGDGALEAGSRDMRQQSRDSYRSSGLRRAINERCPAPAGVIRRRYGNALRRRAEEVGLIGQFIGRRPDGRPNAKEPPRWSRRGFPSHHESQQRDNYGVPGVAKRKRAHPDNLREL